MQKHCLNFIFLIIVSFQGVNIFSQEIPVGTWRDHLSYTEAVSVTQGNNTIYCASSSALFTYDKSSKEIQRLNLVNSLSDIGIKKIKFNTYNSRLIITYENGNIDIITETNEVINLAYIKTSNIVGSKTINNIFLQGKLAYIATGFGIVVLDTDKLEVQDTYLIGNLGGYVNVNSITMDTINIYAATNEGIYFADKTNPSLADYNNWNVIPELGNKPYGGIAFFNNSIFVTSESALSNGDSIFYYNNFNWDTLIPIGLNIENFEVISSYSLAVTYDRGISLFAKDGLYQHFGVNLNYNNGLESFPRQIIYDPEGFYWVADNNAGLLKLDFSNTTTDLVVPNSPSSSSVVNVDLLNDEIWTASGGYGLGLNRNLINHKVENEWINTPSILYDANNNVANDVVHVKINPSDPSQVYAGSWRNGLFELNNEQITTVFNAQNSVLDSVFFGITSVSGMEFDNDNNFWVTSSYAANNPLAVRTADNNWYNFSFPGLTSPSDFYTEILIDENNYKWFISPQQHKILIFDDNSTISNKNDDRKKVNTNFPGSEIECLVQDKDGEIWIGTDEGVAVFYNPSDVFDENIEAEQILIQQDGQTQILLETAIITSIAIDGANRKWLGTRNSGVYLLSEDGTEEIEHFTTQNSPLFSNNIFDIVVNPKTGEVYIATEKGLISYKGTATEPDEDFNNIFVYPNPVKPGYEGKIAIRGLVKDTDVRVTDISGNIVFETTSFGGQAIWDGNDMNGNRVRSGVYMVFNGSQDGSKKAAAKILFLY